MLPSCRSWNSPAILNTSFSGPPSLKTSWQFCQAWKNNFFRWPQKQIKNFSKYLGMWLTRQEWVTKRKCYQVSLNELIYLWYYTLFKFLNLTTLVLVDLHCNLIYTFPPHFTFTCCFFLSFFFVSILFIHFIFLSPFVQKFSGTKWSRGSPLNFSTPEFCKQSIHWQQF